MVDNRRDEHITEDVLPDGSVDPVYQAKAELLNDAIQQIGMGKYQVGLYFAPFSLNLFVPVASFCRSWFRMACRHSVDCCCRCYFGASHSRVSGPRPFLDFGYEHWFIGRSDGLEYGK